MTTEKIPDGLHPKWSIDSNGCNKKPLNADAVVNDLTLDNHALKGALEMAQNDKALLMRENHSLRERIARSETREKALEEALRDVVKSFPITFAKYAHLLERKG